MGIPVQLFVIAMATVALAQVVKEAVETGVGVVVVAVGLVVELAVGIAERVVVI